MTDTTLRAFHGDPAIKEKYLARVRAHRTADEIVKGRYWERGKGCAVGCTIHGDNHMAYEREIGIPVMLARLEDTIFESLPNGAALDWPERFLSAPKVGADLSRVGWQFLHWLMTDKVVNPGIDHPLVRDAARRCADLLAPLTRGEPVAQDEAAASAESTAASAASAAASAESAAWNAAVRAAESAESAAESATWIAESAAWNAAESARSAAASAAVRAAESARSAASAAASAESAAASAESAAWVRMADRLIDLMGAAE